jgi:hypothetical protein
MSHTCLITWKNPLTRFERANVRRTTCREAHQLLQLRVLKRNNADVLGKKDNEYVGVDYQHSYLADHTNYTCDGVKENSAPYCIGLNVSTGHMT